MLNLAVLLEDSAREKPTHTAVIFNETKLSYAAVNAAANQVANVQLQVTRSLADRQAVRRSNCYSRQIV